MILGALSLRTESARDSPQSPSDKWSCSCEPSDEDHDGGGVEEGSGGGERRFRVLPQPAVPADPCEEALDHPALRMDGEADLVGRLANDLDGDDRAGGRPVSRIARVGESLGDEGERAARQLQHGAGALAVLHVGGLRLEDQAAAV